MNTLREEAKSLVKGVLNCSESYEGVDVVVCPPYPFLECIVEMAKGRSLGIGAQNLFYEPSGAYTGEVSAPMLADLGVRWVIIGHSERRSYFGETDTTINRKIKVSLEHDLVPIVCFGETLQQRKEGKTFKVLNKQVVYGLEGIDDIDIKRIVIAYEPVWAIGTGMSATSEQANETQGFIRDVVAKFAGKREANTLRILYGGSVSPKNAMSLLKQKNIDGALVGGASLKAESFCDIIRIADSIEKL